MVSNVRRTISARKVSTEISRSTLRGACAPPHEGRGRGPLAGRSLCGRARQWEGPEGAKRPESPRRVLLEISDSTGSRRRHSSSTSGWVEPGRVEQAPRSTMSAPSAHICRMRATASAPSVRLPEKKESLFRFTMPMIWMFPIIGRLQSFPARGRPWRRRWRVPCCQYPVRPILRRP